MMHQRVLVLVWFFLTLGGLLSAEEFKPLWIYGQEIDTESEVLSSPVSALVRNDGECVILDAGNRRLLFLDVSGVVRHRYQKTGQGPGEFQSPVALAEAPTGEIVVFDPNARKTIWFSGEGEWIKDDASPEGAVMVLTPQFLDADRILMNAIELDATFQQQAKLKVWDRHSGQEWVLHRYQSRPLDWSAMGQDGFWADFLQVQFESALKGMITGLFLPQWNQVLVADQETFHVKYFEGKGFFAAPTQELNLPFPRIPFSDELKMAFAELVFQGVRTSGPVGAYVSEKDVARALKRTEFPEFFPVIWSMFPTKEGFGCLLNYRLDQRRGTLVFLNAQGTKLRETSYEGPGTLIGATEDRLFALGPNQDDETVLICFQLLGGNSGDRKAP